MNKTIFLDRDGTINIEKDYLYKIDEFELMPGALEALHILQNAGYQLVIVTNQSGIARGYYTEEQFHILNDWMLKMLGESGIQIKRTYYCPHHPDAIISKYKKDCLCRKPKTSMYETAIAELDVDINNSFSIGDKIRDCSVCNVTECNGFLIGENEKPEIIRAVKNGEYKNVRYTDSLLEAAKWIVSNSTFPHL